MIKSCFNLQTEFFQAYLFHEIVQVHTFGVTMICFSLIYFIFPPVVAISLIASFNRMKQITDDIGLVVKAMKMSSMLEVGPLTQLCKSLANQIQGLYS